MRAVAKILRARASEHSSNFCEQFEQRPNIASTFKFSETIRYPLCLLMKKTEWKDALTVHISFFVHNSSSLSVVSCTSAIKCNNTNHFSLFCRRGQTVRCNGINRRSSSRRAFQFPEGKGNKIFWRENMAYFYTGMLIQALAFYCFLSRFSFA